MKDTYNEMKIYLVELAFAGRANLVEFSKL